MSAKASHAAETISPSGGEQSAPGPVRLNEEDRSKDAFFVQVAEVAEAMIARHGKDFAMGTLVLSARFIAEGKPLLKRKNGSGDHTNIDEPVSK
jgi:hypothetical protein